MGSQRAPDPSQVRPGEGGADYREAMDRWVGGDREVLFPSGTYWMRVHHGAAVAPFD